MPAETIAKAAVAKAEAAETIAKAAYYKAEAAYALAKANAEDLAQDAAHRIAMLGMGR